MRLTETTRALKRRSTLPKGRNPQSPHFKKFTPLGLLTACIIGSGLLFATTVRAETLTVSTNHDGNVNGNGISCSTSSEIYTDCTESYPPNTQVTLKAYPLDGEHAFYKWEGDCTGTSSTITVTMDKNKNCVASFRQLDAVALWVTILGEGQVSGTGISCWEKECGGYFLERIDPSTQVTVTAVPTIGFQFKEWSGACTGTSPTIKVTLDTSKSCKAVFVPVIALYTTSATDIRAVPLVQGSMPDLTKGVDLVASAPCEDDLTQPAEIVPLSAGEFIAIWRNQEDSCYSRFTPDDNGSFTETYKGQWLGGEKWDNGDNHDATGESNLWTPIPKSADLNGDSIDDLVLIHGTGAGDAKSYQYKVAFGQEDDSFDFTGEIFGKATTCKDDQIGTRPCTCKITKCVRGSYFNLEDADGDGYVDLVFHSFNDGNPFTTTLYMLKGQKEGSFAATPQQLLTGLDGEGSTTPVFGNFKADDFLDVFLPPDDDVSDSGQAYIAFGKNPVLGTFDEVKKSIDFDPSHEGGTSDMFSAGASACDIDLDGDLDIISNESWWNVSQITKVYTGDGLGQFLMPGISLFETPVGQPHPTLTCGRVSWGPEPCVVAYVVHDGGLNDSLLLSVSNPKLQFTPIGTVHKGYDLEALALHPQTGELYASSGENTNKPGYLYKVQEENVVELGQPGAFAGGLEGLSFNPSTNILWGWAQGTGLVKFDHIESNPSASVVLSYKGEIQDLTWNPQGDILYAVENIPQGGKNKVVLWAYHPADGHVVAQCEKELEGWQEVEALQALPNGNLLFGLHNSKKLLTGTIDPNHGCQLGEIKEIAVPYDDIEGIALTACPLTM